MAELIFWSSLLLVAWTYLGYPLGMIWRGRRRSSEDPGAPPADSSAGDRPAVDLPAHDLPAHDLPGVSVVVAVRNGADWLERRLRNLLEQRYPPDRLEVFVVLNGCTDRTAEIAHRWAARDPRVRALESPAAAGKAGALNAGVAAAGGEVVVFADVRQQFDPDAVRLLVEAVMQPRVGAATGRLVIGHSDRPGIAGFGRYWELETQLRMAESATGSVVGATGAIYAVRRDSFVPIPPGTLLDDVFVPLHVVSAGERVAMEPRAVARDEPTERTAREYRRRVRTLAGNLQLLRLAPEVLRPWHPLFVRFMSHKVLRVLSPLFFLALIASGLWLGQPLYVIPAVAVLGVIGAGVLGLLVPIGALAVPASFVLVQAAAMEAMLRPRRTSADLWTR